MDVKATNSNRQGKQKRARSKALLFKRKRRWAITEYDYRTVIALTSFRTTRPAISNDLVDVAGGGVTEYRIGDNSRNSRQVEADTRMCATTRV